MNTISFGDGYRETVQLNITMQIHTVTKYSVMFVSESVACVLDFDCTECKTLSFQSCCGKNKTVFIPFNISNDCF